MARMHKKKVRRGIGWEWKTPADFSESNPAPPLFPTEAPEQGAADVESRVSVAPASVLSVLSSIPESQIVALQNGSGVKTQNDAWLFLS